MRKKKRFSLTVAKQIGDALGVDWRQFGIEQFQLGLETELERGVGEPEIEMIDDEAIFTGKIALAHLKESADYYARRVVMQREADEYWANV